MKEPLPIPKAHRENLHQILHAAKHGMLGVLSTYEKGSDKPAFLLVAKNENGDDSFEIVPFAKLFGIGEDPIAMFEDPTECECNNNNDSNITITE